MDLIANQQTVPRLAAARVHGFTLVETVVTMGILALILGSGFMALNTFNRLARVSRLYTCAETVVRNEIDLLLSVRFMPQTGDVHPALAIGTRVQTDLIVYVDPETGRAGQVGSLTTIISDAGQTLDGVNLQLRRAQVRLDYVFNNRNYSVAMETVRASDL